MKIKKNLFDPDMLWQKYKKVAIVIKLSYKWSLEC